jgi:hypothetical protein
MHWGREDGSLREQIGKWFFVLALGSLLLMFTFLMFGLNE